MTRGPSTVRDRDGTRSTAACRSPLDARRNIQNSSCAATCTREEATAKAEDDEKEKKRTEKKNKQTEPRSKRTRDDLPPNSLSDMLLAVRAWVVVVVVMVGVVVVMRAVMQRVGVTAEMRRWRCRKDRSCHLGDARYL